ncbi:MAG: hypothetical protein AAGD14_06680 [Planctomycetota bacterium]
MNVRTPLTLLALASLVAAAVDPKPDFISTKEVVPYVERLREQVLEVRKGNMRTEDLLAQYAKRASDANLPPRERACYMYLYGRLLASVPRLDDAQKAWRQSLEIFPRVPDVEVELGRVAMLRRDLKGANRRADTALKINPNHVEAFKLKADLAARRDKLELANEWWRKAAEADLDDVQAMQGWAMTQVMLFRESFSDERKGKYSKQARTIARMLVQLNANDPGARIFEAQVLESLGEPQQSLRKLESMLIELPELNPRAKMFCLQRMFELRARTGTLEGAKSALDEILRIKELTADERRRHEELRDQFEKTGIKSFIILQVDRLTDRMSNRLLSATERRDAMRRIHELLSDPGILEDPDMQETIDKAWCACVRTLSPPTPPELAIDMLQFFRRKLQKERRLIRVLVHFVYPRGVERGITSAVRKEATRTIRAIGGPASLPTLLYTLSDDSREVTRAIDVALCSLLERRSMVPPGAGPVTENEQLILRREWLKWTHTPAATQQLLEAIDALREVTVRDAKFNRKQQQNPLAEHVIRVVLLDNDVEWKAWKAGYLFLKDFLGRDFLPVEMRGQEITPKLRPVLRDSIMKFIEGDSQTQAEADDDKGSKPADEEAEADDGTDDRDD